MQALKAWAGFWAWAGGASSSIVRPNTAADWQRPEILCPMRLVKSCKLFPFLNFLPTLAYLINKEKPVFVVMRAFALLILQSS